MTEFQQKKVQCTVDESEKLNPSSKSKMQNKGNCKIYGRKESYNWKTGLDDAGLCARRDIGIF